jgi:hypothetical protein
MSGADKPPSEPPDLPIKSDMTDRRPGGSHGRSGGGVHSRSRQTTCRGVISGGECTPSTTSMYRTVVMLENKVAIGKNSSYRSKHYIFENSNINVRIKPRFHMQHYPRTNRRNPCPRIDTETSTSFCFLNILFIVACISWPIHS